MTLGCTCTRVTGWSRAGDTDTWIHPDCGMPSPMVLEKQDVLNLFRYGSRHNELHETEALMRDASVAKWIREYSWTPELVVGSVSGKSARVWVAKEKAEEV